ncbi:Rne/Rng family ribonuclease [Naumannella sp. ID2617S]|nr:Rne/Rng family ribonuclease [Naumannella sp. ID2617S]
MLEDQNPASSADEELPRPPSGRRAASRPAGPPAPIQEPAPAPEPTAPQADAVAEAAAEAPAPRKRATRKKTAEAPSAPAARTRRTRKGAEPPTAEGDAGDAPADAGAVAEEPARPTRKRASRKKAAPAAQTKPAEVAATEAEIVQSDTVPATAEDAAPEPASEQAPEQRPLAALANPFQPPTPVAAQPPVADEEAAEDEEGDEETDAADQSAGEPGSKADSDDSESDGDDSEDDGSDGDDSEDDDSADDDSDGDDSDTSEGSGGGRRRRRRRGGRRRRRGNSGDDNDDESNDANADGNGSQDDDKNDQGDKDGDSEDSDDSDDSDDSGTDDDQQSSGRRRRRRRRRRGESGGSSDDDENIEVVDRVREPRRSKSDRAKDEVTGIEGSTRMEAKRQRRREGRAAGRRRAPILSEAEFLARRESVDRTMVIRQNTELSQIAVLEDGVLVEHYVDRDSASSMIGNIYLGKVQNVLPSMEAAFIDIGRGRNAVLYAGEVDWDSFGAEGQNRKVEKVLKSGQSILVQVTKDPVGAKGARLTNHISLPGRYIVYAPGGHLSGISRKLPDTERKRLKDILAELVGDDASVIVRTAAEGASHEELVRDVNRLKAQWEAIEKKTGGSAPQQLYAEPDATVRIVRDLFTEDFGKLVIDGNRAMNDAYDTVTAYVSHVAPHLAERIEQWDREGGDIFAAHRIDEQIAKALERKVFLPSGGSLIIDRTEAMTVIDVNTGKFTGSGGNLEATVTSNNLEAAEEVVRQLRLRDIGGIIVIDFIDMVLPSNRELLLRRLVECLGRDRTRHQVAEVTSLGLVQMTRKKIGTGLHEAFTETCEHCSGRGYEIHEMPVETQAPADGGDRRGGRGGRNRGGGNGGNGGGKDKSNSDGKGSDKGQGSDKGKSDHRGGRGRSDKSHSRDKGQDEPQDQDSGTAQQQSAPQPAGDQAQSPEPAAAAPEVKVEDAVQGQSIVQPPIVAEPVAPVTTEADQNG